MLEAASRLGGSLQAAADDDDLWDKLAASEIALRALTDEQRVALGAAVDVDWAPMLDAIGYKPPPPAESQAEDLASAVRCALESRDRRGAEIARGRLRELAGTLISLGQKSDVTKPRARKWLRRGVRVAGRLVIAGGMAAVGVGLLSLPPLAALAPIYGEPLVALATAGAGLALEWVLDRVFSEEKLVRTPNDDPADREAMRLFGLIDTAELGAVEARWQLLAAWRADERRSSRFETFVEETLTETTRFISATLQALYQFWDMAVGAVWFSPST